MKSQIVVGKYAKNDANELIELLNFIIYLSTILKYKPSEQTR